MLSEPMRSGCIDQLHGEKCTDEGSTESLAFSFCGADSDFLCDQSA